MGKSHAVQTASRVAEYFRSHATTAAQPDLGHNDSQFNGFPLYQILLNLTKICMSAATVTLAYEAGFPHILCKLAIGRCDCWGAANSRSISCTAL